MRIFVGIQLDNWIKNELALFQEQLKKESIKGRFTRKGNFHLTIYFIGEMDEDKVDHLAKQLKKSLKDYPNFLLESGMVGFFEKKSGWIPWVGLRESPSLSRIFQLTTEAIESVDHIVEEHAYTPHITLARAVRFQEPEADWQSRLPRFSQKVRAITLFQSHRVNDALTYSPLIEIPLKNSKETDSSI